MKFALLGCGFIGRTIAKAIAEGKVEGTLRIVYDRHPESIKKVQGFFKKKPRAAKNISELIASDAELIIEAGSIEAAEKIGIEAVKAGKDILIMSVGALLNREFRKELAAEARKSSASIYIPSGAIGSLDALQAASVAGLDEIALQTIKNPKALIDAPYVKKNKIPLDKLKKKKTIFEGNAREAIKGFPQNINVGASLSLAGIGEEKTKIKIVADPHARKNIHIITAKGDFGELYFRIKNAPSPENPKTSYIAALSAIALLKKIASPLKIG